jgi:DUF2889 family protein
LPRGAFRSGRYRRLSVLDDSSILPPEPDGLEMIHDREYRVRAYRAAADRILLRGAVRDQKPNGLYIVDDPDPLTFHHMLVELHVAFPSMEIVDAAVLFEAHPHEACPSIAERYRSLVGLSIARGFTHEVRQRFGGPRGCTHTTALLLAMAPVAIQCVWSMEIAGARESGRPLRRPSDLTDEERERRRSVVLNSCHVWDVDGEHAKRVLAGGEVGLPIPMRRRLERLGIDPATFGDPVRPRHRD